MAICAVYGCNTVKNKKSKKHDQCSETKLFSFPRDPKMAKIWEHRCGRSDKVNVKNALICSKHFTKDQYARNLRHELLNYSPKNSRKLRPDAVPTEDLPYLGDSEYQENKTQRRRRKQRGYQVETVFLVNEPSQQERQSVEHTVEFETYGNPLDQTEGHTVECGIQCEIEKNSVDLNKSRERKLRETILDQHLRIASLEKEKASAVSDLNMSTSKEQELQERIVSQQQQIESLQKENQSLNHQVLKLTHENYMLVQESNTTSKIFSATQRRKLRLGGARVQWTTDDLSNCAAILASGPEAYKLLLQKGYPFPAVITIKQFIAKTGKQSVS